jgi:hypothetical protein
VICIDKTPPAPTNVVLGSGNGTVAQGDTLTVTYSEAIDATTFCSSWNNSGNQTLSGTAVRAEIADNSSNDTLSITAVGGGNCGGTANFHFGSVALGGNYVTADRTFGSFLGGSQIVWNPTAKTLTITLGSLGFVFGGINSNVTAGTPVYTPNSALQDFAGNSIVTTPFSAPGTSRF